MTGSHTVGWWRCRACVRNVAPKEAVGNVSLLSAHLLGSLDVGGDGDECCGASVSIVDDLALTCEPNGSSGRQRSFAQRLPVGLRLRSWPNLSLSSVRRSELSMTVIRSAPQQLSKIMMRSLTHRGEGSEPPLVGRSGDATPACTKEPILSQGNMIMSKNRTVTTASRMRNAVEK